MTERQGLDSFDTPPAKPTADMEALLGVAAAPGPQQPDEVRRFRPHNVPPTASELREEAVAEWLWEHDHGQFTYHFGEDGEHHARYIDLARDLLDRDELFPATPSAGPVECTYCDTVGCRRTDGNHNAIPPAPLLRSHRPAAPSAQPDGSWITDETTRARAYWDEMPAGARPVVSIPAQPVRDTGEGRR